jgi:CheY-like chemotaxis protein
VSYPRILQILVIEDDPGALEAYRTHFASLEAGLPHVVTYATSRDDAKLHLDGSEIYHVVILDLNLPLAHRGQPADGVSPGEQLLEDLAKRDTYPIPVLLIVSGKLNLAQPIGRLTDRLKDDFWYGRLVNKGLEQFHEIEVGLRKALEYVDVGIHIRDGGKEWFPTLSPREDDLLRRCILSDQSRVGLDVRWWSAEVGSSTSIPSPTSGPTKVLMGQFLMREGMGTSIPTFFKFEPAGNAPFVRRDIAILSQKLSHIKVFHTAQSRQRSMIVTQSATNRGVPISLNEYLQRNSKEVGSKIPHLIRQISDQLAQLGDANELEEPIASFFWDHLQRDAIEKTCKTCGQGDHIGSILGTYEQLRSSSSRIWARNRRCVHGDLNATNIAIDADDNENPQAYIFDAAGMRADLELRDFATLEITTILFNSYGIEDELVNVCHVMYKNDLLPTYASGSTVTAMSQNVLTMMQAIRSRLLTDQDVAAYALLVFDAVLRQLSGLGIQPSPNKVRNPVHACCLAAWVAQWMKNVVPDLFAANSLSPRASAAVS